jgi:hypothetical protein
VIAVLGAAWRPTQVGSDQPDWIRSTAAIGSTPGRHLCICRSASARRVDDCGRRYCSKLEENSAQSGRFRTVFVADPKINVLIQPKGGKTVGNKTGTFVETRYSINYTVVGLSRRVLEKCQNASNLTLF